MPKDLILTLYRRWNESNKRKIVIERQKLLKTMLTNGLKRLFPNIGHNEHSYLGLAFREGLTEGLSEFREESRMRDEEEGKVRKDIVKRKEVEDELNFEGLLEED